VPPNEQRGVLARGSQIGSYEVESTQDSSEAAVVYRARHLERGNSVALKQSRLPGLVQPWSVEARLLTSLRHPGVVSLVEHFEEPDGFYNLAMELVGGTDLARTLWDRGNPGLPLEDVLPWVRDACGALQYLHEQHVVHADVKPRNLVRDGKRVVLVDFGLAGAEQEHSAARGGTPMFMAPEVFAGDTPSARSDVFGIAATAWTLLTGSPPVYGETRTLAGVPGLGEEIEEPLRAGLAFHPEDRIESAAAFAEALGAPVSLGQGASLAVSHKRLGARRGVLEAIVQAAAGTFEAAAASVALLYKDDQRLRYVASWGAGARETVGLKLPIGVGIAGSVIQNDRAEVVGRCHTDPRFDAALASRTEYVPYTMLVVPLRHEGKVIGVMSLLDRRDGLPYTTEDVRPVELLANVAAAAIVS
jgi:hypothetical protein